MVGKITVGTVWDSIEDAENVYIGRGSKHPSPLANPFVITGSCSRDTACDHYEKYLMNQMNRGDPEILAEMNRIGGLVLAGKHVHLQCYCKHKQLRCHGDFIAQVVNDAITHKVID